MLLKIEKVRQLSTKSNLLSPTVMGRQVWDNLVPYNKVWCTGAIKATIVETDKPIMVEGKQLPADKYSFFAIPWHPEWQFIFNSETGQRDVKRSGEANRDPAKDVLAVNILLSPSATMNERLAYALTSNILQAHPSCQSPSFTLSWWAFTFLDS